MAAGGAIAAGAALDLTCSREAILTHTVREYMLAAVAKLHNATSASPHGPACSLAIKAVQMKQMELTGLKAIFHGDWPSRGLSSMTPASLHTSQTCTKKFHPERSAIDSFTKRAAVRSLRNCGSQVSQNGCHRDGGKAAPLAGKHPDVVVIAPHHLRAAGMRRRHLPPGEDGNFCAAQATHARAQLVK